MLMIQVFFVVLYQWVNGFRRFEGSRCLNLQQHPTTLRYIPVDFNPQLHRCQNLKPRIQQSCFTL